MNTLRLFGVVVVAAGVVLAAPGTALASGTVVAVPGTAGPTGAGGIYGEWGGSGFVDSGVSVSGSVVITATGTINASTNPTFGQNIGPDGNGQLCGGCLAPALAGWSLVARIGSGPWQQGGTGPITLTGTGELVFAVNDGWYGDNSGAFTVTVTVPSTITAQLQTLQSTVTGVGPGSSLADKVAAVLAYYQAGDLADACGTLGAFDNQVAALSGKKLPGSTAQSLTSTATQIASAMGC